jgi:hypothetical protein
MRKNGKFTYQERIDLEIQRYAHKFNNNCSALLHLPLQIYSQIMEDNLTRQKPIRVSIKRIQDIVHSMADELKKKKE